MAQDRLAVSRSADGTLRIEMARPDVLNAFDESTALALTQAFAQAGADAAVRCVVLAGQGRAFCAGADIEWMKRQGEASEEANLADARRFAAMLHRIAASPKPTVARVHGACMGGGVGLACACDFVVAADNARFAVSEARFGILPSVIAPYLIAAVGSRQARRLAIATSRIDAAEALRLGIAHEVVPEEGLGAAVEALLKQLRASGPAAIAEIKSLYSKLAVMAIGNDTLELTAGTIARVRGTAEAQEGFASFLDKRPPRWAQ